MRRILASVFGIAALGSSQAAQNCDAIINHGMRNIEVTESADAAIAVKYFNHCGKDWSLLDDKQLANAEVEVFGYGGGSAGYSRSQRSERLNQWCTTNSSIAQRNQSSIQKSQLFYQGAVTAWDNCNALSSKDIIVTPRISPDAKTVDIGIVYRGGTKSGVNLLNVVTEGFTCTTTSPFDAKPVVFPYEVTQLSVQSHCRRDASGRRRDGEQEFAVLPRGTISVQTSSDPFQLYFPEEWNPGVPTKIADELRARAVVNEVPIGTIVSSVLPPDKFFSPSNPQFQKNEWALADGKLLPKGSAYGLLASTDRAPDLSYLDKAIALLDVKSAALKANENVAAISAASDARADAKWEWIVSTRNTIGLSPIGDWEQDTNHFQTFIDSAGAVKVQSRTLNRKHKFWQDWIPGEANVTGLAFERPVLFHYLKIN